jgi:protein-S-isoprenylcysteine O-methyltransferase Ste14
VQTLAQLAPYVAAGLLIAVELVTLRRPRKDATPRDRGTFWVIQIAIGAGMFTAFSVSHSAIVHDLRLGGWAAPFGLALVVAGGAIRLWAIRTLGRYFTRDIQVSDRQTVVDTGPYRLVRHPSYTGSLLEFLGVGLSLGNLLGLLFAFVPALLSFAYRIHVEEQVLLDELGEPYRAYLTRTKRLLPYVL